MKFNLEDFKSDSIFHFTRRQIAIELILPYYHLKLNDFEKTNDPRENKKFGFGAVNGNFNESNYINEQLEWNNKISQELKKNCKLLCFSQDYYAEGEWWDGYNLPRMWAQYGENHQGVCLEIDKASFIKENEEIFNNKNTFFKVVKYSNKDKYPFIQFDALRTVGIDIYINDFRSSNIDYLFYKKNIDWKTEREIRILHIGSGEKFCSIKNSLKRVILGIDFPSQSIKIIKNIVGNKVAQIVHNSNKLIACDYKESYLNAL